MAASRTDRSSFRRPEHAAAAITRKTVRHIFRLTTTPALSDHRPFAVLDHLLEDLFQVPFMHELLVAEIFDVVDDPAVVFADEEYPVLPRKPVAIAIVDVRQIDDAHRRRALHVAAIDLVGERSF